MNNIVLLEPLIPMNTGNIMRTCVATDTVLHLIRPLGFSLDDKSVKRSGVNYIDKLKYFVYDDFDDFVLKNRGKYYFFSRYGKKSYTDFNYVSDESIYLIFGKETTGIDKKILRKYIDSVVRIPSSSNVRALNLSNCCAVGIYEVLRQQDFNDLSRVEPHKSVDFILEDN